MSRSTTLVLALTAIILSATTLSAAVNLDPELGRRMAKDPDAFVRAVVCFESAKALPRAGRFAHRAESRAAVLNLLKANLAATQERFGELFEKNEDVRNLKWLWIVNGAVVEARGRFLDKLVHTDGVTRMSWDHPVEAPRLVKSEDVAPVAEEWTYGLRAMRVPEVRSLYGLTGAGVRIGHIDTGVDGKHPDLKDRIVAFADMTNLSNTEPVDGGDHGTHTAGTIAGGNASGTQIGVAPGCELVVAKAIGGSGGSKLLESMEWMCDPDGNSDTNDAPRAVSCSWHSGYGDQTPYYEALAAWEALAIIPNFSAGNSGPNPKTMTKPNGVPRHHVRRRHRREGRSGELLQSRTGHLHGAKSSRSPEWAAPRRGRLLGPAPAADTRRNSGTSMAAPHAAGLMALLFEADPELSPADVRKIMQETAHDLGPTGWDPTYGTGRLDALAAVQAVMDGGTLVGSVRNDAGAPLVAELLVVERGLPFPLRRGRQLPGSSCPRAATPCGPRPSARSPTSAASPSARARTRGWTSNSPRPRPSGSPAAFSTERTPRAPAGQDLRGGRPRGSRGHRPPPRAPGPCPCPRAAIASASRPSPTPWPWWVSVTVQGPSTVNAELDHLPPVPLRGRRWRQGLRPLVEIASLERLNVKHDVWCVKTQGEIPTDRLLPYPVVIWQTGLVSTGCLTDGEQATAKAFLEAGGRLLLSGAGHRLQAQGDPLLRLRAPRPLSGGQGQDPQGRGPGLRAGPSKADRAAGNQTYTDVIEGADEAVEGAFTYPGEKGFAALRWDDGKARLYYFGFGLEGVAEADHRDALLDHCISWLAPDAASRLRRVTGLRGAKAAAYVTALASEAEGWSRAERLRAAEVADELGTRDLARRLRALAR